MGGGRQIAPEHFAERLALIVLIALRPSCSSCQCSSFGSKNTRSPGRITSIGPPRRCARPMPSVTQIV
jgi:hypothetical protein